MLFWTAKSREYPQITPAQIPFVMADKFDKDDLEDLMISEKMAEAIEKGDRAAAAAWACCIRSLK